MAELGQARDKESRDRLVGRLAERGETAVPALLAALPTAVPYSREMVKEALWLIGPPAFDAALAALAADEKGRGSHELGRLVRAFDERCLTRYIAALEHPSETIQQEGLSGLEHLGAAAIPALRAVLPFLGTGGHARFTQFKAERALQAIGPAVLPELRGIRRNGPGPLRRHALTALTLLGGESALDEQDRRALERLARIKTSGPGADDVEPLPEHWWFAVPGDTYEGLFTALGLHDRRPCTLSIGNSATQQGDTAVVTRPDGSRHTAYRVFVTPELDGWRLVYADTPLGEGQWGLTELAAISAECGHAQMFFQEDSMDAMTWAVAENGTVRRAYERYQEPEWTGDPMPWETPITADPDYDPDYQVPGASAETEVEGAAKALSLYPPDIGPGTTVRGHGWLAVTEEGVGHGPFAGALRF